jgi:hypothetical protein
MSAFSLLGTPTAEMWFTTAPGRQVGHFIA